jgi:hypothetical protein
VPETAVELADADVDADADAVADADVDAAVDDDDEDEDELLQAAAVRPRQAMPTTTANRRADVRKLSIPRR